MAFDYAGAKAAGYTDQEINTYLESKKSKERTTAQKVSDFFAPASRKFGELIAGSGLMKRQNEADKELMKQLQIRHQSLLDEAQRETDPNRKIESLKLAKETTDKMASIGGQKQEMIKGVEERSGYDKDASALSNYVRSGIGVGAEVGSYLMPTGGKEGVALTKGTKALAGNTIKKSLTRQATLGAIEGGLSGLSEMDSWGEANKILNSAFAGALMSGSTDLIGKGIGKVWKTATKNIPKASFARGLGVKNTEELNKAFKLMDKMSDEGQKGGYNNVKKYLRTIGETSEEALQRIDQTYDAKKLFGNVDDQVLMDSINDAANLAQSVKTARAIRPDTKSVFKGADGDKALKSLSSLVVGDEISFQEALNLKRTLATGASFTDKGAIKNRFTNMSNKIGQTLKKNDNAKKLLELEAISTVLGPMADTASTKTFKNAVPTILEISAILAAVGGAVSGREDIGAVSGGAFMLNRMLSGNKAVGTYNAGKNIEQAMDSKTANLLRNFLWRTGVKGSSNLANES